MRHRRATPPPAAAAVAKVGFDTIEKLQEWLQSQLGADASVGAALSHAFEVQARNSVGPYKLATAPFVPPAALLAFLDTLPEHLRQQQQVGCAPGGCVLGYITGRTQQAYSVPSFSYNIRVGRVSRAPHTVPWQGRATPSDYACHRRLPSLANFIEGLACCSHPV